MSQSYTTRSVSGDYFRDPVFTTESLKADLEFYSLEYAHHMESAPSERTAPSIEFLIMKQDAILEELTRRMHLADRFGNDPRGPKWPNSNDKRYQDLLSLAAELKQEWPIDRFMTVLMGCKLERSSRDRFRCHCPLPGHTDKSPSLVVYVDQNTVHCFGCNRGGDVFDLTGFYFGIESFSERVKKLAEGSIHRDELIAS